MMRFPKPVPTKCAIAVLLSMTVAAMTAGCSTILPRKETTTVSRFATYNDVTAAYANIQPGRTTIDDLATIGFDLKKTPNIKQVNYLQITEAFLPHPGVSFAMMPASVQECVKAQDRCMGYVIGPRVVNEKRVGNIALDIFNFRRKTTTTGWTAEMLLVLLDGVVVYKLWSGEPNIDSSSTTTNPLGPLQNLGAILERSVPSN